MTIPYKQQAYSASVGTSPIPAFYFRDRDPTVYDTTPVYLLYGAWVNTRTHAIWYLEEFFSVAGVTTSLWRSVGPVVVSNVDPALPWTNSADYLYPLGQIWVNPLTDDAFILLSYPTPTTGWWSKFSAGGTGSEEFIPDTGVSPVVPTSDGEIKVKGQNPANISGIRVTGALNELDFSMFSPMDVTQNGNTGSFEFLGSVSGACAEIGISNTSSTASSCSRVAIKALASGAHADSYIIFNEGGATTTSWEMGAQGAAGPLTYFVIQNNPSNTHPYMDGTTFMQINPTASAAAEPATPSVAFDCNYFYSQNNSPGQRLRLECVQNDSANAASAAAISSRVVGGAGAVAGDSFMSTIGNLDWTFGEDATTPASPVFKFGHGGSPRNFTVTFYSISNNGNISFYKGQRWAITTPGGYPYTVLTEDLTIAVNTGAAHTINLPAAPDNGEIHIIKDLTGTAGANNITIQGNGHNIDGAASLVILNNYGSITVQYNSTSTSWMVI